MTDSNLLEQGFHLAEVPWDTFVEESAHLIGPVDRSLIPQRLPVLARAEG